MYVSLISSIPDNTYLLIFCYLTGERWYLIAVIFALFRWLLMLSTFGHTPVCHVFIFRKQKCLFGSFAHSLTGPFGVFCLFCYSVVEVPSVFGCWLLMKYIIANVFSHSMSCLFIVLFILMCRQLLDWYRPVCSFVCLFACVCIFQTIIATTRVKTLKPG